MPCCLQGSDQEATDILCNGETGDCIQFTSKLVANTNHTHGTGWGSLGIWWQGGARWRLPTTIQLRRNCSPKSWTQNSEYYQLIVRGLFNRDQRRCQLLLPRVLCILVNSFRMFQISELLKCTLSILRHWLLPLKYIELCWDWRCSYCYRGFV